jgi:ubiquitin-conjugating enzyme E2 D/E
MTSMALLRINREYQSLLRVSSNYWSARPKDHTNMFIWEANIHNLEDSRHSGKDYTLEITFAERHPFIPPTVRFVDKVNCENVYRDGILCIDILKDEWSPAITIDKVMISICSVLTDPPVSGASFKSMAVPKCSHSTHAMETRSRRKRHNTFIQA